MEGPPIQLWKINLDGFLKLPIGVSNPIPCRPSKGHDAVRSMKKECLLMLDYPNMWNYGSKALNKMFLTP
jgi:hypothetical protein